MATVRRTHNPLHKNTEQSTCGWVNHRTTDGYNDVVTEYVANLDKTDPNTILNAQLGDGFKTALSSDGRVFVTLANGHQYTWASAVRAGMVNLSRAG